MTGLFFFILEITIDCRGFPKKRGACHSENQEPEKKSAHSEMTKSK